MFRFFLIFIMTLIILFNCTGDKQNNQTTSEVQLSEEARLNKSDPGGIYGETLTLKDRFTIASILESPETYKGKKVQVKGTVMDVCPRRGCWIEIADQKNGEILQVKVTDGDIVFPISAKGKEVIVEGIVEKLDLTEDQAQAWLSHKAEESGKTFDSQSVRGPMTIWRLKGLGAVIEG